MKIRSSLFALVILPGLVACDTMDAAPGAGRRPTAQAPLIEHRAEAPTPEHLSITHLVTLEEDAFSYLEGMGSRGDASKGYQWPFEAFNGTHYARLLRAPHSGSRRAELRMIEWGARGEVVRSAKLNPSGISQEIMGVEVGAHGARLLLRDVPAQAASSDAYVWSEVPVTHCDKGLCLGTKVPLLQRWVPASRTPVLRPTAAPLTFDTGQSSCAMPDAQRSSCLLHATGRRVDLPVLASEPAFPAPTSCHSPGVLRDGRALVVCLDVSVRPGRTNCQHCHCGTCFFRCRSTRVEYQAPSMWALDAARPDRVR